MAGGRLAGSERHSPLCARHRTAYAKTSGRLPTRPGREGCAPCASGREPALRALSRAVAQPGSGRGPVAADPGLRCVGKLVDLRRAGSDERLQLKWFAYSSGLFAATLVYGAPAWNFFGQPLYLALTPLEFAGLTLPVAIAVAILRYRLYDIDLIINRTLVYGGLTAILGAVYAAVVTPLNRLFISASGQKSDAAYVVTAFVVVVASSPVKDWLQRQVDRRVRHRSPAAVLDEFRADVESVVSVIDVNKVACRLLDEAVIAFDARAAALYLTSNPASGPVYSHGRMNGEDAVEVLLRHEGRELGRLVLGGRRGQIGYSQADLRLLQRSADTVSEVLVLAAHLGHRQLTEAR